MNTPNKEDEMEQNIRSKESKYQPKVHFQIPGVKIISELGRGVHGAVFKVKFKGKLACAKKFLGSKKTAKKTMANEVKMMRAAEKSKCTPKILAEFQDSNVLIMELCKGKNLQDFLD